MKQIIITLIAVVVSICPLFAQTPTTPTPLDYSEDGNVENRKDWPNRGHRMPPAPIMVVVDVEAGTITGTSPLLDGILRYEIWDADETLCIALASDAATALKAINGCHGTYLLRLRGDGYCLKGYITL